MRKQNQSVIHSSVVDGQENERETNIQKKKNKKISVTLFLNQSLYIQHVL